MNEHDATETAYRNGYADGKPKWISVKERLPELSTQDVLVTDGRNVSMGFFPSINLWCAFYPVKSRDITHWMPLPEPQEENDKPMTNADRIRAMTDEELAKCIFEIGFDCHLCSEHERLSDNPLLRHEKCDEKCTEHCLEWLQQPAEEV